VKQLERSGIPWPVFAVTVAAAFMVALDLSIVNVAFPSIRRSFPEVSTATLSWVLAAYSVVFGALLLIGVLRPFVAGLAQRWRATSSDPISRRDNESEPDELNLRTNSIKRRNAL